MYMYIRVYVLYKYVHIYVYIYIYTQIYVWYSWGVCPSRWKYTVLAIILKKNVHYMYMYIHVYVLYTNVVYICICIHTYTDINLAGVGCGSLARKVYCFGHYVKNKICIRTCTLIYTRVHIIYVYCTYMCTCMHT